MNALRFALPAKQTIDIGLHILNKNDVMRKINPVL